MWCWKTSGKIKGNITIIRNWTQGWLKSSCNIESYIGGRGLMCEVAKLTPRTFAPLGNVAAWLLGLRCRLVDVWVLAFRASALSLLKVFAWRFCVVLVSNAHAHYRTTNTTVSWRTTFGSKCLRTTTLWANARTHSWKRKYFMIILQIISIFY
jgi:hypothetical protein